VNILKIIREKNNLRPVEMAQKLDVSKSYYSMLESGQRPLSKNVAFKLKSKFGVKLDVSLCPEVHGESTDNPNPAA
jgi:transcriptional regulator with XRE-family HTH domain